MQEEERKRFEELKKIKPKTTLRKPTSLAQERNQMMSFLKDSFKDIVPMEQRRKGDVKERGCTRDSQERGKLQLLSAYTRDRRWHYDHMRLREKISTITRIDDKDARTWQEVQEELRQSITLDTSVHLVDNEDGDNNS
ncbi:hypothetical protein Tco_0287749 [Tanacetum coccineum]